MSKSIRGITGETQEIFSSTQGKEEPLNGMFQTGGRVQLGYKVQLRGSLLGPISTETPMTCSISFDSTVPNSMQNNGITSGWKKHLGKAKWITEHPQSMEMIKLSVFSLQRFIPIW